MRIVLPTWLALLTPLTACIEPTQDAGGEGEGEACARDASESADTALELDGATATGQVCPLGDQDYYRVRVPAGEVLRASLVLVAPISPVQIHYDVFSADGRVLAATGRSADAGQPIEDLVCLPAGDYVLRVSDQSDDDADFRHEYRLDVTTGPDADPREGQGDVWLEAPGRTEGLIACRGDVDRHLVAVEADSLLEVHLTSAVATYEPSYRVLDPGGAVLYRAENLSGSVVATDLWALHPLPNAGTYVVEVRDAVVDDADDRAADSDTPYMLELARLAEPDPHDQGTRNDVAGAARDLGVLRCGDDWDAVEVVGGTIASIGDVDWYRLDLEGCASRGIVEVAADATGADGLDPQVRLVRSFPDQPCARDEDCIDLGRTCDLDSDPGHPERDCTGWGNSCVGRVGDPARRGEDPAYRPGLCAGAAACLGGLCGATQVERHAVGEARIETAQPLLGDEELWIAVQDFRSDAADRDTPYRLRVATRLDPDAFERDSVYNPYPLRFVDWADNEPFAQHLGLRTDQPFCVTGTLATEFDEDWFWIDNTCTNRGDGPDGCNLVVRTDFDEGPVDFVVTLARGYDPFFQPLAQDEAATHEAGSVRYGQDECLFAVEGDAGYHLVVADNRGTAGQPATPDWSTEQRYTVCLESFVAECLEPCVQHVAPDEPGCNVR